MLEIRVLHIEDSVADIEFIGEILRELNSSLKIRNAKDGVQAIDLLSQSQSLPNFILLDLNLPRKNGWEFIDELGRHQEWKEIPIYILSTTPDAPRKLGVQTSQVRKFFVKPDEFSEMKRIYETIRDDLRRS